MTLSQVVARMCDITLARRGDVRDYAMYPPTPARPPNTNTMTGSEAVGGRLALF